MKQQLEDLCFAALNPAMFAEIDQMVAERTPERESFIDDVLDEVRARLKQMGVASRGDRTPEAPVVDLREDGAQGPGVRRDLRPGGRAGRGRVDQGLLRGAGDHPLAVGADGRSVQGLHRDAQVQPLPVVAHDRGGPAGRVLEVQIRTQEMHSRAEWGVAAHFAYKDGQSEDVAWLSRIVDWQQEMTDPGEFMANLKIDLEQDEVFVFTPKGDVVTLPAGATPVDFAYAIHTEVGHRCIGARVVGSSFRSTAAS